VHRDIKRDDIVSRSGSSPLVIDLGALTHETTAVVPQVRAALSPTRLLSALRVAL